MSQHGGRVEAHEGCRLVLRVGVLSGMSGLPSGGQTGETKSAEPCSR